MHSHDDIGASFARRFPRPKACHRNMYAEARQDALCVPHLLMAWASALSHAMHLAAEGGRCPEHGIPNAELADAARTISRDFAVRIALQPAERHECVRVKRAILKAVEADRGERGASRLADMLRASISADELALGAMGRLH